MGDESFIALRKRRRRHRTLEAVESRTRVYEERRLDETRQAEATAAQRLQEAQAGWIGRWRRCNSARTWTNKPGAS